MPATLVDGDYQFAYDKLTPFIVICVLMDVLVVGLLMVFWLHRHGQAFQSRIIPLTILNGLSFMCLFTVYMIRESTVLQVPCPLDLWISATMIPVWVVSYLGRAILIIFKYKSAKAKREIWEKAREGSVRKLLKLAGNAARAAGNLATKSLSMENILSNLPSPSQAHRGPWWRFRKGGTPAAKLQAHTSNNTLLNGSAELQPVETDQKSAKVLVSSTVSLSISGETPGQSQVSRNFSFTRFPSSWSIEDSAERNLATESRWTTDTTTSSENEDRWFLYHNKQINQFVYRFTAGITLYNFIVTGIIQRYSTKFSVVPLATGPCHRGWEFYHLYAEMAIVIGIAVPWILRHISNLMDAYGTRKDLTIIGLVSAPLYGLYLIFNMIDAASVISPFPPTYWVLAIFFLGFMQLVVGPLYSLLRVRSGVVRRTKAKNRLMVMVGVSTNEPSDLAIRIRDLPYTKEGLVRLLTDAEMFNEFKSYTVSDFTIENTIFYEQYSGLYSKYSSPNLSAGESITLRGDVHRMYDIFIRPGASYELNLSSSRRREASPIFEAVKWDCDENFLNRSMAVLAKVNEDILQVMYQNSYSRFLQKYSH